MIYLWDIFRSSSDEEVLLNGHLVAGIRAQQPCTGCSRKIMFSFRKDSKYYVIARQEVAWPHM